MAAQPAGDPMTVRFAERYAQQARELLASLDLSRQGLQTVASRHAAGDPPGACDALLAWFKDRPDRRRVLMESLLLGEGDGPADTWAVAEKPAAPSDRRDPRADAILNGEFSGRPGAFRQPRLPSGHIDWLHRGPNNDIEHAFGVNRHNFFLDVLRAWFTTGNPAYAAFLADTIRDWITFAAPPRSTAEIPPEGEATNVRPMWRELEVGIRLFKRWPAVFFALVGQDGFDNEAALLMLWSVGRQAAYLMRFHGDNPNHCATEMLGLASAAACWPEFSEAPEWLNYARKTVEALADSQLYPDGSQKELTCSYHLVALGSLERAAAVFDRLAGISLSAQYRRHLERMWEYVALVIRPDGLLPINNDSWHRGNPRELLRDAAARYGRPDWLWFATNGREGKPPAKPSPSVYFPWAGQLIMRSGPAEDAHWAFFDCGPGGLHGHQHYDKLNLCIMAHGRDFLVDAGAYWYRPDALRQYYIESYGHNTILVDGRSQGVDVETVSEPLPAEALITPEYDYAHGVFDTGYVALDGQATHARAVLHVRDCGWIVVDRIVTDRPRVIQALWHFHPDCAAAIGDGTVYTKDDGKPNLRIAAAAPFAWDVSIVKGRKDPDTASYRMWRPDMVRGPDDPCWQGWYAPRYNEQYESPCAVFRARIDRSVLFAWAIAAGKGDAPAIELAGDFSDGRAGIRAAIGGEADVEALVDFVRAPQVAIRRRR